MNKNIIFIFNQIRRNIMKDNEIIDKRNISFDIIRIVSIILVLFTHTGSKIYTKINNENMYYFFSMWLDVSRIICVPLFLMISGALLLEKKESMFQIFRKRIVRMFCVLFVFSVIQYFYAYSNHSIPVIGLRDFALRFYTNTIRGQLWFLYIYLAFLLMFPFLQGIAKIMNIKLAVYLIILSTFADFLIIYNNKHYAFIFSYIHYVTCYSFLFPLLGYGIYRYTKDNLLSKKYTLLILGIFLITTVCQVVLVYYEHKLKGEYSEFWLWRFNGLAASCIFIVLINRSLFYKLPLIIKRIIVQVSSCVFGIYLCENILYSVTVKVFYHLNNIFHKELLAWGGVHNMYNCFRNICHIFA